MNTPKRRLAGFDCSIPELTRPAVKFVPAVRSGNYVFTSGHLPMRSGQLLATGKVGDEVTEQEASDCARLCALNAIGAIQAEISDLSLVRRVVKVLVFVSSMPTFTTQPKVANGASDLIVDVFAGAGIHARSAVGVASLPFDAPVAVQMIAELESRLAPRTRRSA
jgi:enamine deaminase RidA (YjgF/YER057c/UK114 family)